jgi:hypothetical protein
MPSEQAPSNALSLEQLAILHLSTLAQKQEREILRLSDSQARMAERLALLESRYADAARRGDVRRG